MRICTLVGTQNIKYFTPTCIFHIILLNKETTACFHLLQLCVPYIPTYPIYNTHDMQFQS